MSPAAPSAKSGAKPGTESSADEQAVLADRITRALWSACVADARLLGGGNDNTTTASSPRPTDGALSPETYHASARAAAPTLSAPHQRVGQRILSAVEATQGAVGIDTNLGVLLLAAPLVHAVLNPVPGATLRERVSHVLNDLDHDDAELAWRAVCLADPQAAPNHPLATIGQVAGLSLRQIMQAQAEHDRIAYQYANDYADIFAFALPRLRHAKAQSNDSEWPLNMVFLGLMARFPDSHIVRSHGQANADALCSHAAEVHDLLWNSPSPDQHHAIMDAFFATLQRGSVQPRTSADLAVATLLAARLQVWTNPDDHLSNSPGDDSPIPLTPRG